MADRNGSVVDRKENVVDRNGSVVDRKENVADRNGFAADRKENMTGRTENAVNQGRQPQSADGPVCIVRFAFLQQTRNIRCVSHWNGLCLMNRNITEKAGRY